jgi:hypothetical protein
MSAWLRSASADGIPEQVVEPAQQVALLNLRQKLSTALFAGNGETLSLGSDSILASVVTSHDFCNSII